MNSKYEYLNQLSKKLDESQQKVCFRTDNTVVAAGAGSGKTQTLATRFAWLVMSKNIKASKILTLTFTNKAANEMYERIYRTLTFFATEAENIPTNEKKRAIEALEDFSEVHIQTLDSYCGNILRQCTNRYGIKPNFVSSERDLSVIVQRKALEFVIKNKDNPTINFFVKPGDLQDFANRIFAETIISHTSLASEEDFFVKKLNIQRKVLQDFLNNKIELESIITELENIYLDLDSTTKTKDAYVTLKNNIDYAKTNIIDDISKFDFSDESCFCNDENISFVNTKINEQLEWIKNILSLGTRIRKNPKADNPEQLELQVTRIKNCFAFLKNTYTSLLQGLYEYIEDYWYIKSLYILLDEFLNQVNEEKRISGLLTFFDITEMALKILIEQKDIREQEKKAFDKIMIDEFQDNNGKNKDLLFLLSEKDELLLDTIPTVKQIKTDKLFFVGDQKQSIYKFRGADVSVFNKLKTELGEENFLQMVNNYRSEQELITSFNILFGGKNSIFKKPFEESLLTENYNKDSMVELESYEATYITNAIPIDKKTFKPTKDVVLTSENIKSHVCYLNELELKELQKNSSSENYLDKRNQLAYFVAKKIKQIYDSLEEEKKSYSNFAILEPTRTNRDLLVRWLSRFGIPYVQDVHTDLFSDSPINDIYNFLRLCVYPQDLKSLAVFLCSPFVGLSQISLEIILSLITDSKNDIKIFSSEHENILQHTLSKIEFAKYKKASDFFTEQRPLTLKRSLTETLNILWYECGYYYETLVDKKVNLFAEQYDFIFELGRLCDEDGKSIGWFIDELAKDSKSFNEIKYPIEKTEAVQIMTIHKSKGLEFDYVFVLDCINMKSKKSTSTYFYDDAIGLSLKSDSDKENFFYTQQKELSTKKEIAELRRLLYVAITRAVKEYYIVGLVNNSESEFNLLEKNILTYYPKIYQSDFAKNQPEFNAFAPYDILSVQFQTEDVYKKLNDKNTKGNKEFIIKNALQYYEDAKIELTPYDLIQRITPSSLELEEFYSEKISGDMYSNINDILAKEIFDYADFGTLAHGYLEYFVNNYNEGYYDINNVNIAPELTAKLLPNEKEIICDACKKMVEQFANTKIGCFLLDCKKKNLFYKSEYGFKLFENNSIITGSIDLIFEVPNNKYIIVDYKTDSAINNEKYYTQQRCYKKAAQEILNVDSSKIECYLYYLRFDKLINITPNL